MSDYRQKIERMNRRFERARRKWRTGKEPTLPPLTDAERDRIDGLTVREVIKGKVTICNGRRML